MKYITDLISFYNLNESFSREDRYPRVIVLTWRKRRDHEKSTKDWLNMNLLYDKLIMQEGWVAEKNHVYKEKELIKLQEEYEIVAMFDDNENLIPVCKRLWIPLFHVNLP